MVHNCNKHPRENEMQKRATESDQESIDILSQSFPISLLCNLMIWKEVHAGKDSRMKTIREAQGS